MVAGGYRPGAGRPKGSKGARTVLREQISLRALEDCAEDADYGLALFRAVMRNDDRPIVLRLEAAKEVMNRHWGKPTQHTEESGTKELQVTLIGGINAVDEEPPAE